MKSNRKIYTKLFPAPIARRMIKQRDNQPYEGEFDKDTEPSHHITHFANWRKVEEEFWFWGDLEGLYYREDEAPTEDQIKEVFATYNIPYK